jgi:hypothetical protein
MTASESLGPPIAAGGPPHAILASDAERAQTAARLKQACVEGRLTLDEFGERVKLVHAARTRADLEALTHDLPAAPPEAAALVAAPIARGAGGTLARRPPQRFMRQTVALMSSVERTGSWQIGEVSRVVAVMGSCKLDLRDAALCDPVTTIAARIVMGSLEVIVPPDVEVELDATAIAGSQTARLSRPQPGPRAPLVRITGVVLMGSVTVRDRLSLGERLSAALGAPHGPA